MWDLHINLLYTDVKHSHLESPAKNFKLRRLKPSTSVLALRVKGYYEDKIPDDGELEESGDDFDGRD